LGGIRRTSRPGWVAGVDYRWQAQKLCSFESNGTECSQGAEVNPDGPMGAGCKRNPRLPAAFESEAAGGV